MTTVYRAAIMHSLGPDQAEYLPRAELVVDGRGTIVEVRAGWTADASNRDTVVDFAGKLLIPGLVDTHVHIPQIDVIGVASEGLLPWLRDHVFPAEAACADPEIARDRAQRSFDAMLAAGTTTCAAYSSRHTQATEIAFEQAQAAGIRAIIGKVLMDREAPPGLLEPADSALADTAALIKRWSGAAEGRLEVAITPRFALSCSPALLAGAGALAAATGVPIQTHLAENAAELAAVGDAFPDCSDYTAVYETHQLIGPRTLLAHCIHLSDDEIARLAAARAAVTHCPDSNFYLHSGRFPLARVRQAGIRIGLASDVGAGTCYSIVEAMKLGNYTQDEPVRPEYLLYLATLGGAQVLGWDHRIGNFRPGKQADFAVVRDLVLPPLDADPAAQRVALSRIIHRGQGAAIEAVYVDGVRRDPRAVAA